MKVEDLIQALRKIDKTCSLSVKPTKLIIKPYLRHAAMKILRPWRFGSERTKYLRVRGKRCPA